MKLNLRYLSFLLFFAATTIYIGRSMKQFMPTVEVVGFEFIRTSARVDTLINSDAWQTPDANNQFKSDHLRAATRLDFLYIISYVSLFISLFINVLGYANAQVKRLIVMMLVAGLSDFFENILLLSILDGGRGIQPAVMAVFAALKFGLLALSLLWMLAIAGKRLWKRIRRFN